MITLTDSEYESILKDILQCNVTFYISGKKWREGKFLLFKQSGFGIEFTIRNSKDKIEVFEVPIPFNIKKQLNNIKLSYDLIFLSNNNKELYNDLLSLGITSKNKFFNTTMDVYFKNE